MTGRGAGAREITVRDATVFTVPWANSDTTNRCVLVVGLSDTETWVEAEPLSHATVAGRPETRGDKLEKVQRVALFTEAVTVTEPPVKGTGFGVPARSAMVGAGGG